MARTLGLQRAIECRISGDNLVVYLDGVEYIEVTPSAFDGPIDIEVVVEQENWRFNEWLQTYTICNITIGLLVLWYSAINHFRSDEELKIATSTPIQTYAAMGICGLVYVKDIFYLIFYPHLSYLTYFLMMISLVAPIAYIHTRQELGDYVPKKSI